MNRPWLYGFCMVFLGSGCGSEAALPAVAATEGDGSGTSGGMSMPLCQGGSPLAVGDAPWVKAPFAPPGDNGQPGGDDDGGYEDGGGFASSFDLGGGASFECDVWAQDCPAGQKCMAWANDGGNEWNARRCSDIDPTPAMAGEACTVEGNAFSGVDSCDGSSMCWEVDRNNEGTCVGFCEGDEATPTCPDETWCFIGYEGTITLCLPDALCADDGVCQCMCPTDVDPDCEPGQCDVSMAPDTQVDDLTSTVPVKYDDEPSQCPDTTDPVVLYMSNDDSNSQASPILARRMIRDGYTVKRSQIRIHEFLNYFDLSGPSSSDAPAQVGMQMRRTDADAGEFTLVLQAQGQHMDAASRPAMNLVFSLDSSGSMSGERISLLKDTMFAIAGQLRAGDVVSVVTWNASQAVLVDGLVIAGPEDPELMGAIQSIEAGGSTDLHSGLVAAYNLANTHHINDGINRVVLISDGGANTGVTDIDLIASESQDNDGEGTYLVGVGVGDAAGYRDDLMDAVTDAGKGAYVFVDSTEEAEKQFGHHFLANMVVSARNVRMKLTLPWYFGIKAFHGEEYSPVAEEVEPQHLAPNDAMTFHQIISACDASLITTCDEIRAQVDYVDPLTGKEQSDELRATVEGLVQAEAPILYKSDVVVGYAKALIVIAHLIDNGKANEAVVVARNMHDWSQDAAVTLGDGELQEISDLMAEYAVVLQGG